MTSEVFFLLFINTVVFLWIIGHLYHQNEDKIKSHFIRKVELDTLEDAKEKREKILTRKREKQKIIDEKLNKKKYEKELVKVKSAILTWTKGGSDLGLYTILERDVKNYRIVVEYINTNLLQYGWIVEPQYITGDRIKLKIYEDSNKEYLKLKKQHNLPIPAEGSKVDITDLPVVSMSL